MRVLLLATLLSCAAAGASTKAPAPPAQRPTAASGAQLDAWTAEALRDGAVGLQVAVLRGDRLTESGYGMADLEAGTPVDARSVFLIGSITKQFTAAAVLLLAEQGKLRLSDRIETYVPQFPVRGKTVTLEQLLTHTSGIRNYTSLGEKFRARSRQAMTPAQLVALFQDEPFDFEPGEHWAYSNSNYALLGVVIERVSGRRYADFLAAEIFPRAGLTSAHVCENRPVVPHRVRGYSVGPGGTHLNADFIDLSIPYAAGAICMTAGDLARWTAALEAGKVLSKPSYARMTTPARTRDGKPQSYAMGLVVSDLEGHRSVGHGGAVNGFASAAVRFPAESVTVVVLANAEVGAPDLLVEKISRAALGLPQVEMKDLPVPDAEATRFAGTYVTGSGTRVEVARVGDRLVFRGPGGGDDALQYQGDGRFQFRGGTLRIEFPVAGWGPAGQATLRDGRREVGALHRVP